MERYYDLIRQRARKEVPNKKPEDERSSRRKKRDFDEKLLDLLRARQILEEYKRKAWKSRGTIRSIRNDNEYIVSRTITLSNTYTYSVQVPIYRGSEEVRREIDYGLYSHSTEPKMVGQRTVRRQAQDRVYIDVLGSRVSVGCFDRLMNFDIPNTPEMRPYSNIYYPLLYRLKTQDPEFVDGITYKEDNHIVSMSVVSDQPQRIEIAHELIDTLLLGVALKSSA